jgi:hypothetical protein
VTPADQYRKLASQLQAHAREADSEYLRIEWEHLAHCYLRLAEQADKNSRVDVSCEPPILRTGPDGEKAS